MSLIRIQKRTYNFTNNLFVHKYNREYIKRRNRIANIVYKEELQNKKKKKGIEDSGVAALEALPFDEVPVPEEILKEFSISDKKKSEGIGTTLVSKKSDRSKLSADDVIKRAENLKPLYDCKTEMEIIELIDSIYCIDVMSPKLARICFLKNCSNLPDEIFKLGQLSMEKVMNQISTKKCMDSIDIFRIYLLRKFLTLSKNIDTQYFEMMKKFMQSNDYLIALGQLPKSYILAFVREVKLSYIKKEIDLEVASEYIDIFTEYCFKNNISLLNMETLLGIGYFLTLGKLKYINQYKFYSMIKFFLNGKNLSYHKDEAKEVIRILNLLGFKDYANSLANK